MSDRREAITSVGPAVHSWRCRPPRAAVGTCWVMQWMLPPPPAEISPPGSPISKASLPAAARSRRQMAAPRRRARAQTLPMRSEFPRGQMSKDSR